MRQDFSKVTPDQLAELFPVLHEPHNPDWKRAYREEAEQVRRLMGRENIVRISHVGSTAVPGLMAKPTVDLLVEVADSLDLEAVTDTMLDHGYVVNRMPQDLVMFLKGYTPQGFKGQAFHIHVRHSGDWDELYFRDYLIAHPEAAAEYAALKTRLRQQYPNDRDGYTGAKGAFVGQYSRLARAAFPGRYTPK